MFAIVYYVDHQAKYASGGDLVVDGIAIDSPKNNNQIQIFTGESVQFYDISFNEPTAWEWEFEAGEPHISSEQNPLIQYKQPGSFDVSLKVSNADGSDIITKTNTIIVTDKAPIAKIVSPSAFRNHHGMRSYFVPAKEQIRFYDVSENYPHSWTWSFDGAELKSSSTEPSPLVYYNNPGLYSVALYVENSQGSSSDASIVEAGYQAVVSNMQYGEKYTSLQTDYNEYFPGNNSRIEAYAEYFEKPAVPILLDSIEISFVNAQMHEQDIMSRIQTIRVRIYKAENYQPVGKELAWGIIETLQVEYDRGRPTGVYFGSDLPLVIDFPFMVVVENIPTSNEYDLNMTIGMAPFREQGNTTYLRKKNDDKFISTQQYFGVGKQTSMGVTAHMTYLILQAEVDSLMLDGTEQTHTFTVNSTTTWSANFQENTDWCSVNSTINNAIEGSLTLAIDENSTDELRTAELTIFNGYRTQQVVIAQAPNIPSTVENVDKQMVQVYAQPSAQTIIAKGIKDYDYLNIYSLDGKLVLHTDIRDLDTIIMDANYLSKGLYVIDLVGANNNFKTKIILK